MLCNMNPPTAESPALLQHAEVETFFHEFGHIMHSLCAEGDYNMTHLAKCPRDFVEAPSQMLENWCWQPEVACAWHAPGGTRRGHAAEGAQGRHIKCLCSAWAYTKNTVSPNFSF